jgi:hypothetical protein
MEKQIVATKRTFDVFGVKVKLPKFKIQDVVWTEDRELEFIERDIEFFTVDGKVFCSDQLALDYWGEYERDYPWIHESLEEWAKSVGCYWEWENTGTIILTS